MKHIKLFFAALFLLISLDVVWFGFFASNFYRSSLGSLLRVPIYWPAGLLVWILMTIGLIFFVMPRVNHGSSIVAFLYGALYGLILYGVYNFTNYAVVTHWPISMVFVDLAWGAFINGILSVFLLKISQMLK